jgi:hypothetical protein
MQELIAMLPWSPSMVCTTLALLQDGAAGSPHVDRRGVVEIVAVSGATAVFLLWVILTFIRRTVDRVQREQSRREIAAYVAEGTMTAEQGERLMNAGERPEGPPVRS